MFYNHEVLTSRTHGVATVWLVATLGSKSALKRVNRKQILSVDVPKACETIITPTAPMALRLTSNLLYGVSRVYQQQCGYVLIDAQTMQNNMHALLKVVHTSTLDMEVSRTRPEALLLEDDPAYIPELNLANLELDIAFLPADLTSTVGSQESSLLSPHTSQTSLLSADRTQQPGNLVIPTSDTGGMGDIGGFDMLSDRGSVHGGIELLPGYADGFLPDVDFSFDADGNMVEFHEATPLNRPVQQLQDVLISGGGGQRDATRSVEQPLGFDVDDLNSIPPDGRAMETDKSHIESIPLSARSPSFHDTSSVVAAPQRKRQLAKPLAMDQQTELPNQALRDWNELYVGNMADAVRTKKQQKANAAAKRVAENLTLGAGLGGVGNGIGHNKLKSPLDMFSGEDLYRALTGHDRGATSLKRTYDQTTTDDENVNRRVRARSEELARGDGLVHKGGDELDAPDDVQPEIARESAIALDDFSSMPWNIQPSLRGSSVGAGHVGSTLGSVGRPSSFGGLATSLGGLPRSRRGSRMVSASPLTDRALPPQIGGNDTPGGTSGLGDDGFMVAPEFDADDGFETFGPAAGVDTQTAEESQWQRAVLDTESNNFLGFVEDAIEQGIRHHGSESESVTFETLLDPHANTRVVAAQAFLHVLSLGTRTLLRITQELAYGNIEMSILRPVAA